MNSPFYYWLHEEPHDYYRYTEFALRRFVETSGMEVIELKPSGGVPEILADILAKSLVQAKPISFMVQLAKLVQLIAAWFVGTGIGSRFSASTASKLPLGYFLIARKPNL
jgi:hypothetical protein